MALIVEDGSVVSGAESYTSVASADTYIANFLNSSTWIAQATADKERFLRRATQYVDNLYGPRWSGIRIESDQLLDWPRANAQVENYLFDHDAIPLQLEHAVAEVAVRLNDGIALTTDSEDGNITAEKVKVGPITVDTEFQGTKVQITVIPDVDMIIAPLLDDTQRAHRI